MALGYSIAALPLDYTYISEEVRVCVHMCVFICVSITPQGCMFTGGWVGTTMGISKQTLKQPFL